MPRLIDSLQPGQRVFVAGMSGESALLRDELLADPERARDVTFCGVQYPGVDRTDYLALHPEARMEAHFMSPAVRAARAAGRADLMALDYRGIARHVLEGPAPDVAIAQMTPPDADGWCSPGLSADLMPLAWPRAKRRVAHLNPRLPRTPSSFRVHVSEIDCAVEAEAAPLQFIEGSAGAIEAVIGAHVAALVQDGDTLQFGIGALPVALGHALKHHRRLRLHGGLVASSLRAMWDGGALDRDARITTGVVLGDSALHGFAASLPTLWLTDVRQTHDPAVIAAIPRFIAVNSAMEVDLFGQINAERAQGAIQSGAGGLQAYAQAAMASPGGRLVICLPATARKGTLSRIVPALSDQALCTVPRHLADAIVTEHGVASLRGQSVDARAQALIGVAAPEHRDALAAAWDRIARAL